MGTPKKNDDDVDRRRRVSARVCDCVSNREIEADWVQFIKHCYIMQLQRQKKNKKYMTEEEKQYGNDSFSALTSGAGEKALCASSEWRIH